MPENNIPTVTIAIPAFNEEKSICRLIGELKHQTSKYYLLDKIKVYSDGSTDKTVEKVKNEHPDVIVFNFESNLGKNNRLNQIFQENESDILIQTDADIYIKDNNIIDKLVIDLMKDPKIGIACPYHIANKSNSLIGRIAYFGYKVWDTARNNIKKDPTRYYCEGGLRAFSKEFSTVFKLPTDRPIADDPYSFYFAVLHGYKVVFNKNIAIYFDLAEHYTDYVKQMKRFLLDSSMMKNFFGNEITKKYEVITSDIKTRAFFYELLKDPLTGFLYILLQAITKFQMPFYKPSINWSPITRKTC